MHKFHSNKLISVYKVYSTQEIDPIQLIRNCKFVVRNILYER